MNTDQTDAHALKGQRGLIRIFHATRYSLAGLQAAWHHEAAFRQIALLNTALLPLACMLDVTPSQRLLLMLTPLSALMVELLNSAIEATVDYISLELHPLAKRAKDMGSAAQLVALIMVVLTWIQTFL